MKTVFIAMHNPNIHESCFGVLSVHDTLKGAEMAAEWAKKISEEEDGPISDTEAFRVFEFEVQEYEEV